MAERFHLDGASSVVEVACNDGYLLQYVLKLGVPVLGIEPAATVAKVARDKGMATIVRFFGAETARDITRENQTADLLIANNVLAHVPGLNDFVSGLDLVLKPKGVITVEFPHLLNYCGIRSDFIAYVVNRTPYKQGLCHPGTHIPIHAPERVEEDRPDYLLILPWNFKDEIMARAGFIREWGGRFIVPIPEPVVVD